MLSGFNIKFHNSVVDKYRFEEFKNIQFKSCLLNTQAFWNCSDVEIIDSLIEQGNDCKCDTYLHCHNCENIEIRNSEINSRKNTPAIVVSKQILVTSI